MWLKLAEKLQDPEQRLVRDLTLRVEQRKLLLLMLLGLQML